MKVWAFAAFASALSVVMAGQNNVTIDDLDSSIVLSPLASWSWSNQGVGVLNNTFSFSNDIDATVTFTFPQPATGVSWRGFKRSGAALYSTCIDCNSADDPKYELVDGHDSNAQPNDPVTILFSKQGLSNAIHNITIKNLLDSRFLAASQITLDGFVLTTLDNATASPPSPPASTSMPLGPSSTALSAGTPTPVSHLVHAATRSPVILGAVTAGGVILVLGGVIGFLYWRRRRSMYSSFGNQSDGDISPMMETFKTMPMDAEARDIVTGPETHPYTNGASSLYQQFPPRPGNHPAPDVFSNIAPGMESGSPHNRCNHSTSESTSSTGSPHGHYNHSASESTSSTGSPHGRYKHSASESTSSIDPFLSTTRNQQPSSSDKETTGHIPISLSNPFTNSSYELRNEANPTAEDEESDVRQWYPSSIISDYSTDPDPTTNPFISPRPRPALGTGRSNARPVSSASSVFPSASLRVSAIVDAMRDAMITRSKTGSPPEVVQEVLVTRRPPGRPSSHQLSPPSTGGHSRSPSSSPHFF